jgi:hypothetical protein
MMGDVSELPELPLAPSGDTTGVQDLANIRALMGAGITDIHLQAGEFYLPEPVPQNLLLRGEGAKKTWLAFT